MPESARPEEIIRFYLSHRSVHVRNRAAIILATLDGTDADNIATTVGVSINTVEKWQQAWQEEGLLIFPTKEEAPSAAFSLPEATRLALLQYLQEIAKQSDAVRTDGKRKNVHNMRVAIRRWRSIHRSLNAHLPDTYTDIAKRVRKTGRRLGPVRDLDVLSKNIQQSEHAEILKPLLKILVKDRKKAYARAADWLDSDDYAQFIDSAIETLSTPIESGATLKEVLPTVIGTQAEMVRAYDAELQDADEITLHELRIEVKRLRYLLEAFSEQLGSQMEPVLEATRVMQIALGQVNDTTIAAGHLREIAKRVKKSKRKAIKKYRKSRTDQTDQLRAEFMDAWHQFMDASIQHALDQSLSNL